MGLNARHLGQTLAMMRDTLHTLNERFDVHVCGEGGEYESATLDGPLFRARLTLEGSDTVTHAASAFAPVAYLRAARVASTPKEPGACPPPLSDAPAMTRYCRELLAAHNALFQRPLAPPVLAPPAPTLAVAALTSEGQVDAGQVETLTSVGQRGDWLYASCRPASSQVGAGEHADFV